MKTGINETAICYVSFDFIFVVTEVYEALLIG
jgi:hypothetical protein